MMLPAAACALERPLDLAVVAEHHPPAVRSSHTLDELRALAAKSDRAGRHPTFGFYGGVFGYAVDVTVDEAGTLGCGPAVHVQVRMFLDGRLVEIGTDLRCQREAVLSHYLAHADRDDRLLSEYARRVTAALDAIHRPELFRELSQGDPKTIMTAVVRRVVDEQLRSYDADRQRALDSADSAEELTRLQRACGHDL